MNINSLSEVISKLSRSFGKIINYHLINKGWTAGTKLSPLFFTVARGTFVYHPANETANISRYKQKLDKKNLPKMISSPIEEILEGGFVTTFVEGDALDTLSVIDIPAVAQLQATFHQVDNPDLTCWTEKIDRINAYLLQHQLVNREELHTLQFSAYGLIHGDYSSSNLVKTPQGLVAIDLEHILEGPIAFDLARPLLRICRNNVEQATYLNSYFQGRSHLSQEELCFGMDTFFLVQAYDRHRLGRPIEAQASIRQFRETFE